ncbi:MAG: signal peptidase I [Planctomycetia bacterium]|nr:signal peptidase I [Planctomycetia bacterium]
MKTTTEKQPKATADRQQQKPPDNWRETIESIVVAFVLAFLFRTFEAEAFVIPTGSMAPTLYGQHRDVTCRQCGTRFAAGVNSMPANDAEVRDGAIVPHYRTHFAVCPNANCRFLNDVLDRETFAGDRILVNKFPYEFHEPERWDVVVFKFPENAKTNYIKRLVGKPGEELKLLGGDVWVRPLGDETAVFRIPRKPPEKQRQLQLLVHDDDHPAAALLAAGWPESWAPIEPPQATKWTHDAKARAFRVDPADDADHEDWIRYTHYVPTAADWTRALAGAKKDGAKNDADDEQAGSPALASPAAHQIKDSYAYNNRITAGDAAFAVRQNQLPEFFVPSNEQEQWVGDLTLTCTVETLAAQGEAIFELVEGQRKYRCTIDLKTGRGALGYTPDFHRAGDRWEPAGEPFEAGMNKPGKFSFSFANVDDRLCVWVDDRLVKSLEFDEGSKYPPAKVTNSPTDADLAPVGIGARMAKLRVSHLKIERDVYYRTELLPNIHSDPDRTYIMHDDPDDDRNDEFLMLGDNSPRSNDSRGWAYPHTVSRHLLIGKAFFVYWPHGVPFLNNGRGYAVQKYYEPRSHSDEPPGPPLPKFSLPFYPNVGRMHRIR